jgi:hypothetical protein
VAISVSPHKDRGASAPLAFRVQSGVAFTTLINALVVALAALVPGENLGIAMVSLAGAGISATIGLTVLSLRSPPVRRDLLGLLIVPVLGALYALQLATGIDLLQHPSSASPVRFETLLMIVFFLVAITKAWQMIGARSTRVTAVVSDLLRERQHRETVAAPDSVDDVAAALGDSATIRHNGEISA